MSNFGSYVENIVEMLADAQRTRLVFQREFLDQGCKVTLTVTPVPLAGETGIRDYAGQPFTATDYGIVAGRGSGQRGRSSGLVIREGPVGSVDLGDVGGTR